MKLVTFICLILLVVSPGLHAQYAPVSSAGIITDAVPGDTLPVHITVTDFTDIGHFTLTMKFDTTRVRFISASPNQVLQDMEIIYTPPSGNTQGKLVMMWTGEGNISLDDSASIAVLTFQYITGTGLLKWAYSFGSICTYKRYDGNLLVYLNDAPKSEYYFSGGISNRAAPVIFAPEIANPSAGELPVLLMVNNFNQIAGFTLYLEYDPSIITYQNSFIKNPAFDLNFLVTDNPGINGKRFIIFQWFGSALSLPGDAPFCTLNFSYPAPDCGSGALHWYDNGPTCEYSVITGDRLIDMPRSEYYIDGLIEPGLASVWTGIVSNDWQDTGNWSGCGLPDNSRKVIIPFVSTGYYPVISGEFGCHSLEIQPGASLLISPTGILSVGN